MALSHAATAAALASDAPAIEVVQAASREEALRLLPTADLAVPLMTRLGGAAIAAAAPPAGRRRTNLQYGVGVGGVGGVGRPRQGEHFSGRATRREGRRALTPPNLAPCPSLSLSLFFSPSPKAQSGRGRRRLR